MHLSSQHTYSVKIFCIVRNQIIIVLLTSLYLCKNICIMRNCDVVWLLRMVMLLVAGVARYQSRSHRSLTGAVTTASGAVTVALCHSLTLSRTTLAVFTDNSGNLRIHCDHLFILCCIPSDNIVKYSKHIFYEIRKRLQPYFHLHCECLFMSKMFSILTILELVKWFQSQFGCV